MDLDTTMSKLSNHNHKKLESQLVVAAYCNLKFSLYTSSEAMSSTMTIILLNKIMTQFSI